jgi:RNA polymerase sigma-70 factor (ECF subfamily)
LFASLVKFGSKAREDRQPLFERLMSESYRQAYNLAMRLTGDPTEAEDLLQESYLRAFRFFHRYDETLPFTSWLYRIMTNVHIDSVRRRSRIRTVSIDQGGVDGERAWELPDEKPNAHDKMMEAALDEPIQLGLRSMTPEFRTAVLLADVDGLSYEEVADIMRTSVGTVRSRIHRGRRQLREYLEKRGCVASEVSLL